MLNTKKILHISPDFNYSCGVSKYVFSILKHYSRNESYRLFFITNGGDALDKLKDIGVTPFLLNFSRGWKNIFNILSNLNTLKNYCLRNNIDIIHTYHRYPEYLAYLVSKEMKVKTISTVLSLVEGKNKLSYKSDKLIAVSRTVEKMLKEKYNVPSNKIIMSYNCIEPSEVDYVEDKGDLKNKLEIPLNFKIILFLGRIATIKGIDILLDAFKILQDQTNNFFLLIVGQIYDKHFKYTLNNLPSNIKLVAPVRNPYPFYSIADVIVLPSRKEPFPYVMLESGLVKKPFVGANTGGIAEFIDDRINGLLFDPGNAWQLAEKIRFVLSYPEEAKLLGENLYLKVMENISCKQYYRKLDQIYNDIRQI